MGRGGGGYSFFYLYKVPLNILETFYEDKVKKGIKKY